MVRQRDGSPFKELRSPLIYGILAHSHSWKKQQSKPADNIQTKLDDSVTLVEHPRDLIDLVCVADLGMWSYTAIARYEAEWNSVQKDELQAAFGTDWGPMTAYSCAANVNQNQTATFQPIGALIGGLTHRMAWNDADMRDLAQYYTKTNLGGSSQGGMRSWPTTVYSDAVRKKIQLGGITTDIPWDEWTMALF